MGPRTRASPPQRARLVEDRNLSAYEAHKSLPAHVRVFDGLDGLERFLLSIAGRIKALYLDDAVYGALAARGFEAGFDTAPEPRARGRVRGAMLLADNPANYYRLMLERGRARRVRGLEK